jgi:hypothetical protein
MSTVIAAVVYGAFAAGYVSMLVLTERSAGRYVHSEIREPHPRTAILVIAPSRRAQPMAGMVPVHVRETTPAR